jgi:hypothetical protein
MKLRILVLLALPLIWLIAQEKKADKKTQPKAKDPVVETSIPAGAKEIAPNTYRYTDPKGKTWIYRRTPFGVAKLPDRPVKPGPQLPEDMKAFEEGDSIRFERPTPFGKTLRWVRKKTELNEMEQAVWDHERKKQAGKAASQK